METYVRYAVYYVPPPGPLADFGAAWLGHDIARGTPVPQMTLPGLDIGVLTAGARRYGFHATLKPPFRLARDATAAALRAAVADLARSAAPVRLKGLVLGRLGGFLALLPAGATADLSALAARIVADLDGFRAPADGDEMARRRGAGLTPAQEAHLARWGYPYVMEEFRFHMTLTGRLDDPAPPEQALGRCLAPLLPAPFALDQFALVGEREGGAFVLLDRHALTGNGPAER